MLSSKMSNVIDSHNMSDGKVLCSGSKLVSGGLCALLFAFAAQSSSANKPNADIQVNSSNFSITATSDTMLSISVSMDAKNNEGSNVDWWLAAGAPAGWFYYKLLGDQWLYSGSIDKADIKPSYQGILASFEGFEVTASITGLPTGQYELYFAVDTTMDGNREEDEVYEDSVFVKVTEGSDVAVMGEVTIMDVSSIDDDGQIKLTMSTVDQVDMGKATVKVSERLKVTGETKAVYSGQAIELSPYPIKLAIVLDRSGSLNNSEEALMEDGTSDMLGLLRDGDTVEVINVATKMYVDAKFDDSLTDAEDAIREPSITRGWTRIYDAIIQGSYDAADFSQSSKAVFVVTDGKDNRSENSLNDIILVCNRNKTPVFIVGLADESDTSDLDVPGLTRLAEETGGRFVQTFDPLLFYEIMQEFARSMTTQYELSYTSPFSFGERTIIMTVEDGETMYTYERVHRP